jgi:hypothetical protein
MRLSPMLSRLDNQYRASQNYLNRINALQGGLQQQQAAQQQRYDSARLQNMRMDDYIAFEKQKIDQNNKTSIELRRRNQELLQQNNEAIIELNAAQRQIPADLGTNSAIQNMHGTLGRMAASNTTVISMLGDRNEIANKEFELKNNQEATRQTLFEKQLEARKALDERQTQFVNEIKK